MQINNLNPLSPPLLLIRTGGSKKTAIYGWTLANNSQVKIGIEAPKDVTVHRSEIYEKIMDGEN